MRVPVELRHVFLSVVALGVGVGVYLLDRGGQAYFVPHWLAHGLEPQPLFGAIGANLPTFVHVFAFALLTAAALRPWPRLAWPAAMSWTAIDGLAELGQLDAARELLSGLMPMWVGDLPFASQVAGYFVFGTFDALDLVSIGLGGAAASLVILSSE